MGAPAYPGPGAPFGQPQTLDEQTEPVDFSSPTEPVNFSLSRPLDYGATPDYARPPPGCAPDNAYGHTPDRTHDFRNMNGKKLRLLFIALMLKITHNININTSFAFTNH